jgi:hypothetical protein
MFRMSCGIIHGRLATNMTHNHETNGPNELEQEVEEMIEQLLTSVLLESVQPARPVREDSRNFEHGYAPITDQQQVIRTPEPMPTHSPSWQPPVKRQNIPSHEMYREPQVQEMPEQRLLGEKTKAFLKKNKLRRASTFVLAGGLATALAVGVSNDHRSGAFEITKVPNPAESVTPSAAPTTAPEKSPVTPPSTATQSPTSKASTPAGPQPPEKPIVIKPTPVKQSLYITNYFDQVLNRNVPTAVYLPATNTPEPMVIFVPGRGKLASDYSRYLTKLASEGYVAVSANFSDISTPLSPSKARNESYDIQAIYNGIHSDPRVRTRVNTFYAAAGVSDGGGTALTIGCDNTLNVIKPNLVLSYSGAFVTSGTGGGCAPITMIDGRLSTNYGDKSNSDGDGINRTIAQTEQELTYVSSPAKEAALIEGAGHDELGNVVKISSFNGDNLTGIKDELTLAALDQGLKDQRGKFDAVSRQIGGRVILLPTQ